MKNIIACLFMLHVLFCFGMEENRYVYSKTCTNKNIDNILEKYPFKINKNNIKALLEKKRTQVYLMLSPEKSAKLVVHKNNIIKVEYIAETETPQNNTNEEYY